MKKVPEWMLQLEEEEWNFIKRFVQSSGSLKKIAEEYEVTYPTVRIRLDKLIEKINSFDEPEETPYAQLIKQLALDDKLDFNTAKILLDAYKKEQKE